LLRTMVLIPVSLMPTFYGFGGIYVTIISVAIGLWFMYTALRLFLKQDLESARKVMFASFIYLPVAQLALMFDFIIK